MKYMVTVSGRPGCTVSPLELFSHLNPRWTWVRDESDSTAPLPAGEDDECAVGMCITDACNLTALSSELAKMPGAGISSVRVFPLQAS